MVSERGLLELNARAINVMQFYHDGGMTPKAKALMVSEIHDVAKCFAAAKLGDPGAEAQLLKLITAELIQRYGTKAGSRLNAEFVRAFGSPARPLPVTPAVVK